jgi:hypothetical protein
VAYSDGPTAGPVVPACVETTRVTLWPWEYLFQPFTARDFPDLHRLIFGAAVVLLVATVIFYNVRTRQLHRHSIYVQMYEWLLWTGVVTSSLIVVYWIFRFDMIIVMATLVVGLSAMVWIRFVRFPPFFRAYERQLAKQRYFSRQRFAHPETTIRTKASRRRRRR